MPFFTDNVTIIAALTIKGTLSVGPEGAGHDKGIFKIPRSCSAPSSFALAVLFCPTCSFKPHRLLAIWI